MRELNGLWLPTIIATAIILARSITEFLPNPDEFTYILFFILLGCLLRVVLFFSVLFTERVRTVEDRINFVVCFIAAFIFNTVLDFFTNLTGLFDQPLLDPLSIASNLLLSLGLVIVFRKFMGFYPIRITVNHDQE